MDSRAIKVYLFDAIMDFIDLIYEGKIVLEKTKEDSAPPTIFGASIMLEAFMVQEH